MKSWWKQLGACVFGFLMACQALAATESGRMSRKDAWELATQVVWYADNLALPPRDATDYASAKDELLLAVAPGEGDDLDRATVYTAARRLLATIDSDGHTQLWPRWYAQSSAQETHAADAARADVARVVRVDNDDVLVLRPPQATFMDVPTMRDYALHLNASVVGAMRGSRACALVVDLSDQKGGNAWPPLALLGVLVTPANRARYEDRAGRRTVVVPAIEYASYLGQVGPLPSNPLTIFAGTPPAVVMAPMTASSGEMLAIVLAGEPGARTFGQASHGETTANNVLSLADGATMLLTVSRYAMEGGPVIRGRLQPDFPAASAETPEQSIRRAATWAAANSALCRAP